MRKENIDLKDQIKGLNARIQELTEGQMNKRTTPVRV